MRGPILNLNGGEGMGRPVTASAIQAPTHGWQAAGRTDLTRTVRSAGRHSRFVRALRIVVPAAVVLGLGGYFAVS